MPAVQLPSFKLRRIKWTATPYLLAASQRWSDHALPHACRPFVCMRHAANTWWGKGGATWGTTPSRLQQADPKQLEQLRADEALARSFAQAEAVAAFTGVKIAETGQQGVGQRPLASPLPAAASVPHAAMGRAPLCARCAFPAMPPSSPTSRSPS